MKERIALLLLRVSIGIVFLCFGIGKFSDDYWTRTIKTMDFFLNLPWDVNLTVLIVGGIEVVTGIFLILGFLTRTIAGIAALQLISILILLDFSPIRDIGLLGGCLYLLFANYRTFGIDYLLIRDKS